MIITNQPPPPAWAPGPLDEPRHRTTRRRRWPLLLATALAAGTLLCWYLTPGPPHSIGESHLAGPRPPGTIGIIVLLDNSGSFQQYTPIREQALQDVMTWSGSNLRPDDTVTVIGFAGNADVILPTTPVSDLAKHPTVNTTSSYTDGTQITPAITTAHNAAPSQEPKSLIVVTDTRIEDADPTLIDPLIADLHITTMTVITPSGVDITDDWSTAFPYENTVTINNDSTIDTALAMGKAIAHATGQQLVKTT